MKRLVACLVLGIISVPALAGTAAVRHLAESQLMLGDTIEHVLRTPYAGLYEVDVRGPEGLNVYYVNSSATLIFSGQIIDARNGHNLTRQRLQQLSSIRWQSLPFKLAIKTVHGTGHPAIAVFSDPNCPYCRRLEKTLTKIQNLTVYTFLYPVLEPSSPALAKAVWCSADPASAWRELMLNRRQPTAKATCRAPVRELLALGKALSVTTTPTWFLQNGERRVGPISRMALAALLRESDNDGASPSH